MPFELRIGYRCLRDASSHSIQFRLAVSCRLSLNIRFDSRNPPRVGGTGTVCGKSVPERLNENVFFGEGNPEARPAGLPLQLPAHKRRELSGPPKRFRSAPALLSQMPQPSQEQWKFYWWNLKSEFSGCDIGNTQENTVNMQHRPDSPDIHFLPSSMLSQANSGFTYNLM